MIKTLFALSILFLLSPAHGYQSVLDTGDILPKDNYRATLEPQFVLSGDSGVNFIGRLDAAIDDTSEFGALLGAGATDFHTGFYYKMVPFPDYRNQPALALKFGFEYGKRDEETEFIFRVVPIASKKFKTELGHFNAYVSAPVGIGQKDQATALSMQLVGGSKFNVPQFKNIDFAAEAGFSVNQSISYISFAAIFYIDDVNGLLLN